MTATPPLAQIAFSVVDLRLTEHWFREGFGLLPAGGARAMFRGPLTSMIQGLPGAASTCWWLVGRNPWFQLELFQFEQPMAKLIPADQRACDIGYRRIGLWVTDFDATLSRLTALGSRPLGRPIGPPGARRACVRSPDGVFVEFMEEDPLPDLTGAGRIDCPCAIRSVTLSVPDLDQSAAYFSAVLGRAPLDRQLHTPDHEALWGLAGAQARSALFQAGDILIEIVQYTDPIGRPWPEGYRISDQGILNIALGLRNKADHTEIYARARAAGGKPNCRPIHLFGAGVVYVNDPQGFSLEILWMGSDKANREWGFEPLPQDKRPQPDTREIILSVTLDAPAATVWSTLADHDGMAEWSGFKSIRLTRHGADDRDGYGAEREMEGPSGRLVEQVVAWDPPNGLRYRVIAGSPLICHQGKVTLTPKGQKTELQWRVRFRPRRPFTGALLEKIMGGMLNKILRSGLPRVLARKVGA